MVLLDVDFSEGDFLTAGAITSTSSVNGITTTVNSNTLTKLKYVSSDTSGSIDNDNTETTLATVLVPANAVSTGIIVYAMIGVQGVDTYSDFKMKIGPTSSEVQKQIIRLGPTADGNVNGASMLFYDSTQTWSADVTILITAQNSTAGVGDISTCFQTIVTGY